MAGAALGKSSPVFVYSPLVGLDFVAARVGAASIPLDPSFEYAALTVWGEVDVAGEKLAPGTLLYLGLGREHLSLRCAAPAQLLIIGGIPFDEEVLLWWNFVARSPAEIEAATHDWNSGGARFGEVKGSDSARLIAPDMAGLQVKGRRG